MRILNKKHIKLQHSTPVYDLTSPKYHNFVLGCGATVHNTARLARDKSYQEILPLKGKILNVYKAKEGKAFDSDEVLNILKVIGFDPTHKQPLDHLRIGKLILLSDSDVDGSHINVLILSLLAKYLPGMFERNMVYIVNAPEYVTIVGDKMYYGNTLDELKKKVPGGKPTNVTHLKGWGEASPEMLRETAFDPKTRKLLKVKMIEKAGMKEFVALMAENIDYRAKLLGIV